MRLFFTLAVALMATAGTTGCQSAISTNYTSAMPQAIASTGCSDCAAPVGDGSSTGDCGCQGSQVCDDTDHCGCGGTSCGVGSGLAGGPVNTPVRNLAARMRARTESGASYAEGSGGHGAGACADGSCGSGQSASLFGGLFRRPGFGGGYGTMGGGHGAGMGPGGMGHGGIGRGGIGACGVSGCGIAGRLCGRCGAGNEHPYGGMSPHTPQMAGPYGPMSATYGYPYYTTRGPRDFFLDNPPSLGR